MRSELQRVLDTVPDLKPEEVPGLLGELETVRATVLLRLTPQPVPSAPDELLDINQTALRLGVSTHFLYRHAGELPFSRRMGRSLRFSSQGIDRYIRRQGR